MAGAMDEAELTRRAALLVEGLGYTLWDVSAPRLPGRVVVTLDGVGIQECARVARALAKEPGLGEVLGEGDLEVSTPGVGRKLRTPAHFEAWRGRSVRLRVRGRKEPVLGLLGEVGAVLALGLAEGTLYLPLALVEKAWADG